MRNATRPVARARLAAAAVAVALWSALVGHARQAPAPQPTFRTEIALVEVSAVVTGDGDAPIADLAKEDFEILEDGERRPIVSARYLSSAVAATTPDVLPPSLQGVRLDEVVTNRALADAPAFVMLLDDLNISAYDSHRAIRAGLGVLGAIPGDALVSVVNTSGAGGGLLTLGRPNQGHEARVRDFRGQYLEARAGSAGPSWVDTPCSGGADSPDCSDPTRAARRARALEAVGELFSRTGSRRKVLIWIVTDMGVSPLDPDGNREAQFAGLQRLLRGDVTVYAIDPRENVAPTNGLPVTTDRRTGGRMRVGTSDTQFGGRGGSTMTLNTDDMVGVPLSQLTRETGGRWIQNANNVEKLASEIVTQNLTSYVLAYESQASKAEGRHKLEVRVKRRGARVSARRALVVLPNAAPAAAPSSSADVASARLREVIQGGAPFGSLALRVHVAPQFADRGPARALVTVRVDADTAVDAPAIDLLVVAADDAGKVGGIERFVMSRPTTGAPWEGSITLTLERGSYQLRVAASTPDGARTGLLLHPIDMRPPVGNLVLGVPTLLGEDAEGVRPTLARTFPAGHPLAFQVEVAGEAVRNGTATVHARLVDASGTVVKEQDATTEPSATPSQLRATGLLLTDQVAPGAYTLVVEARHAAGVARHGAGEGDRRSRTHAIPVTLGPADPSAVAATATVAPARTLTPLAVAHGPYTRHDVRGPQVIRSEEAWTAFWRSLPTRQAAPDIDFSRVTLLAVVAEDDGPESPRITRVTTEPGGLLVEWTTTRLAESVTPGTPVRPFVVVGLTQAQGRVRFQKTPAI
jgi:VWFA-related protein